MRGFEKGLKLAFLAAVVSGISVFLNKFAVASLPDPALLPAIKNFIVGIMFLLLLVGERTKLNQQIRSISKLQALQLLAVGVIGGFIPFYMFFVGLSQIPAVNANIIHKTLVVWVAIFSPLFLREKITKIQALAVLGLFASNLLPGGFGGLTYSRGEVLVLLATILWAIEVIIVKKLALSVETKLIATFRMGLGSILLLFSVALKNSFSLDPIYNLNPSQWFWIFVTSLTLFAYVYCWYHALKFSPAIEVSVILVSSTIITNILNAIFVTHSWNLVVTAQSTIIAASIMIFATPLVKKASNRN